MLPLPPATVFQRPCRVSLVPIDNVTAKMRIKVYIHVNET